MIHLFVTILVKPMCDAEFTAMIAEHAIVSRLEDNCFHFQVVRTSADPLRYVLVERWLDDNALFRHRLTNHYARWRARVRDMEIVVRTRKIVHSHHTVFTSGCFDVLHAGHLHCLHECKRLMPNTCLIVGLNSDASVRRLKGEDRPVQSERDRQLLLEELRSIDVVVPFDDDTPTALMAAIRPDVLVKGSDWRGRDIAGVEHAGRVHFVDMLRDRSTSRILSRHVLSSR
jgi:D-beta-D-heptose 7-phosphate kinase/D-beta-D-heptose 1-phosphate adenosyltransferase